MGDDGNKKANCKEVVFNFRQTKLAAQERLWFNEWTVELFTFHWALPDTIESHWNLFYLPLAI